MRRNIHFLKHLLATASKEKRNQTLRKASKEQINAASEMVLNVLHKKIRSSKAHARKLIPHAKTMMDLTNKKISNLGRKKILMSQKGHGLISVLRTVYK